MQRMYKQEMGLMFGHPFGLCKISSSEFKRYLPSSCILDTCCFGVVLHGKICMSYNGMSRVLSRGTAFFNLWETVFEWQNVSDDLELFLVFADEHIRLNLFSLIEERSYENLLASDFMLELDEVRKEFFITALMLIKKLPSDKQCAENSLVGICSLLLQFVNDSYEKRARLQKIGNVDYKGEIYRRFMNLLRMNCHKERSVAFYANELCITRRSLANIIKEICGMDVKYKIDEYVLMKAKILLAYSSMSMLQISEELHFTSLSAFTIYFKRITDQTPMEYRRQVKYS